MKGQPIDTEGDYLSQSIRKKLDTPCDAVQGEPITAGTPIQPDPVLWRRFTNRERQIFACLCMGWGESKTSDHLGIERRTIRNFMQAMYHKARCAHQRHALIVAVGRIAPPLGTEIPAPRNDYRETTERAA